MSTSWSWMEELEEWEKAKQWFGQGEIDVDLMVAKGAVTKEDILAMYRREISK